MRHGGHTSALTVKATLDGRVCVLTVTGDLDCLSVTEFLMFAARAVDERTERLVLDLGGLTFLDAAGARGLALAAQFPPSSCPVIIWSLSARTWRVLDLMDLDLGQEPVTGLEHHDTVVRATHKRSHLAALSRPVAGRQYRPSAGWLMFPTCGAGVKIRWRRDAGSVGQHRQTVRLGRTPAAYR